MHAFRWLSVAFFGLALLAGGAWWLQRQATEALRGELELVRQESGEIARLRSEQERLKAAQPDPAELERLRADRSALLRMRAEIESLQAKAEQKERLLAAPVRTPVTFASAPGMTTGPALTLGFEVTPEGGLFYEGRALDLARVRQQLAALTGPDKRVQFRVQMPASGTVPLDAIKRSLDGLTSVAKELQVRFELLLDTPKPVR
jgi:hypothetical protein